MQIEITLNGEKRSLDRPLTVNGLLEMLGFSDGKVAVERNLEIVPRSEYQTAAIQNGDRIEIVRFIGGG